MTEQEVLIRSSQFMICAGEGWGGGMGLGPVECGDPTPSPPMKIIDLLRLNC